MRPQHTLSTLWASFITLGLGINAVASATVSCNQLSNPYQGPSDTLFDLYCNVYETGGSQVGPTLGANGLESCIDLCATTTGCKVALFDRSQQLCYMLDGTDGLVSTDLFDTAVLLSSASSAVTSSTAQPTTAQPTTTTSTVLTPTPCDQLDNPSYIDGVKLSLICGKQATGGNQIDYRNQIHSLTECMTLCADNLECRAVTFDNFFSQCTLYDGLNGFMSNENKDMAVVMSRPAALSTTTSFSTATTTSSSMASTTTSSGPLSCSQMAGSVYTGPHKNRFTLQCDTTATGASIYQRAEEDSMQGCLDRCDNDDRCIALNFYASSFSECDLIDAFTGTRDSVGSDFALKLPSLSPTTSSETSSSIPSTSELISSTLPTTTYAEASSFSTTGTQTYESTSTSSSPPSSTQTGKTRSSVCRPKKKA